MKTSVKWLMAGVWLLATVGALAGDGFSIRGSDTFGEELGPKLISAFLEQNPDIPAELESLGSASGRVVPHVQRRRATDRPVPGH